MVSIEAYKIMENARRISNIENTNFISEDESLFYVNEGIRYLYDIILGTATDVFLKKKIFQKEDFQFSIDFGNPELKLPLPESFGKLRGVYVLLNGHKKMIQSYPKLEGGNYPHCAYRVIGDCLIIINPDGIDSVMLEYYEIQNQLKSFFYGKGDLILLNMPIYECFDFLTYYVAENYHRRQERETAFINQKRKELENKIVNQLKRNEATPEKVANVFNSKIFGF